MSTPLRHSGGRSIATTTFTFSAPGSIYSSYLQHPYVFINDIDNLLFNRVFNVYIFKLIDYNTLLKNILYATRFYYSTNYTVIHFQTAMLENVSARE